MPGDLNLKKSWNPGLIKNQKKLWQQEQDALKEYQTIKNRAKEIEEEREQLDYLKLQYGDDLENVPADKKLQLNKMGWMYDDAGVKKEPTVNESGFREFDGDDDSLLNKRKVEDMLSGSLFVNAREASKSRLENITSVGKVAVENTYSDDPLLKIKSQRMRPSAPQEKTPDSHRSHRSRDSNHRSRSSHREKDGRVHKSDHRRSKDENRTKSEHRTRRDHRSRSHHKSDRKEDNGTKKDSSLETREPKKPALSY